MASEREILPGVNSSELSSSAPPNEWEGVILVVIPKDKDDDKVDRHIETDLSQLIIGSAYASRTHPFQLDLRTEVAAQDSQQELVELAKRDGYATVVAAGDGIVNAVGNLYIANQIRSPIVPGWRGNANEMAKMTNGAQRQCSIGEILTFGNIIEIFPIETNIELAEPEEHPDFPTHQLSLAWNGWGGTAQLAQDFDAKDHRESLLYQRRATRLIPEGIVFSRRFLSREGFEIEFRSESDQNGTDPEILSLYELTYAKASRMAKGVAGFPTTFNGEVYRTFARKGPFLSKARWTTRALFRKPPGTVFSGTDHFTTLTDVLSHRDGQATYVPEGSDVHISQHDKSVAMLSLLLKANSRS